MRQISQGVYWHGKRPNSPSKIEPVFSPPVPLENNSMIAADLLRRLRKDMPMPVTIATLGRQGPPAKRSEGYYRFLCPGCGEMLATVNPRNNLAHCFCCN